MEGHLPPQGPPQNGHINRQFPPSFGLYRDSALGRKFVLGAHQSQPLYAVTVHTGLSGQPSTVLHNGPSSEHPPLAGADASMFGSSSKIDLPPLPGGGGGGAPFPRERLESAGGFGRKMRFAVEVGAAPAPGSSRRETFEWRRSSGPEVAALGASHSGWKLVRLSTDAPGGAPPGTAFVEGGAKSGSDGREVVAVWASHRMSVTKELQFQFLGSGASGILGERWAIMAVITALRMWDRARRRRRRAAS